MQDESSVVAVVMVVHGARHLPKFVNIFVYFVLNKLKVSSGENVSRRGCTTSDGSY